MIEAIVPDRVAAADTRQDVEDAALFRQEEAAVAKAVDRRRREYTTARVCARRAMARLGVPPAPIVSGPRGEPCWPDGLVGSMTHCEGYRGAVLGRRGDVHSIGIDAEPNLPLPEGVLEAVSLPTEREWVGDLTASHPGVCWDRLLFCTKEAVYKTWYPLAHCWLDFAEAAITVDAEAGRFSARLLVEGPRVAGRELRELNGRWAVDDGLLLTAIVLLRD